MRYFKADEAVYEQVRHALDDAWGLPDSSGTLTCFAPSDRAPRDAGGKLLLAVHDEFCGYSVVSDLLPQLLASGDVNEISESEYWAAFPAD